MAYTDWPVDVEYNGREISPVPVVVEENLCDDVVSFSSCETLLKLKLNKGDQTWPSARPVSTS